MYKYPAFVVRYVAMYGYSNPTVRSTEEGEQVGPKMHSCVSSVDGGPIFRGSDAWESMNRLAKAVGPNGSQDYGYRIVKRCISKGLIELDGDHPDAATNGRGAVVLTEKGKRYLANHD
jgi:glutamine amidotransferase-like uncharacterized protein